MRGLCATGAAMWLVVPAVALAQADTGDAPPPTAAEEAGVEGRTTYLPADFTRFAPKTALDMLNNVPGFAIVSANQGRGLGEANANVLINGDRIALKSESAFDRLRKITAANVVRIEIVDGASLGIPGLSGQVANIVTAGGALSGSFSWDTRFRPGYVEPEWLGGNVSLNGTAGRLEYTLAVSNNFARGAVKGPIDITDADGILTEERDTHLANRFDGPKIAGTLKWDGPGTSVGNFNASYQRTYFDSTLTEDRTRPDGADAHLDYDPRERGSNYEIGGDFEFALGPGRLKLIGLERYSRARYREDYILTPADGSPATGSRYTNRSESGERIGRGEYSWKMLGGDWQLAAEAAFNRYNGEAELFDLDRAGVFIEQPFPFGTGGVTEDRYEAVLTHTRQLASNLSLQIGGGAEYSKLAQTGAQGLTRTFQRPKGSASLAWTPTKGLDLSIKLARVVGQLAFGDFLDRVDLDQGNGSAGNVSLVPPQSWEAELEIKKDLARWGSTTLKLAARRYQDYIEWIAIPGDDPGELLEARGNIDSARLYRIESVSTINLDPLGWNGAKIDATISWEDTAIDDPITGQERAFSGWNSLYATATLRHDVPDSDWAWGVGFDAFDPEPYYRLFESGWNYEGPVYTFGFVENKDVFGLTLRAEIFNATDGDHYLDRTVYDGYRGDADVLFRERGERNVGPIYSFSVKGTF